MHVPLRSVTATHCMQEVQRGPSNLLNGPCPLTWGAFGVTPHENSELINVGMHSLVSRDLSNNQFFGFNGMQAESE